MKGLRSSEWLQLILGLLIPLLLFPHFYETRVSTQVFDIDDNYAFFIINRYPEKITFLFLTILVIWVHGMLGLHMYLKEKTWYPPWKRALDGVAIALSLLAFWGIISVGKEISLLKQDVAWVLNVENASNPQHIEVNEQVMAFIIPFPQYYLVFLLLFFAIRFWINRRTLKQYITISYRERQEVTIAPGTSLLEASL